MRHISLLLQFVVGLTFKFHRLIGLSSLNEIESVSHQIKKIEDSSSAPIAPAKFSTNL